jgi:hypothetical protein
MKLGGPRRGSFGSLAENMSRSIVVSDQRSFDGAPICELRQIAVLNVSSRRTAYARCPQDTLPSGHPSPAGRQPFASKVPAGGHHARVRASLETLAEYTSNLRSLHHQLERTTK